MSTVGDLDALIVRLQAERDAADLAARETAALRELEEAIRWRLEGEATLDECGRRLGLSLSTERIRQIERAALVKLHRLMRAAGLDEEERISRGSQSL